MLSTDDFKQLVQNAPLFAVDLVVLNEKNQVLVGQRVNPPAQGFWFVPGGRVYKNESLEQAFQRISSSELGLTLHRHHATFLGLFDHFYSNSFFSEQVSTHYINATHAFKMKANSLSLPLDQHTAYRWLSLRELEMDQLVHPFSKIFLSNLRDWLNHD